MPLDTHLPPEISFKSSKLEQLVPQDLKIQSTRRMWSHHFKQDGCQQEQQGPDEKNYCSHFGNEKTVSNNAVRCYFN